MENNNHSQHPRVSQNRGGELKPLSVCVKMDNGSPADNIQSLKKEIEKGFLEIRGWKNWKEYNDVQESSAIDINIRNELIDTCIQKAKELFKKKINDLKFKGRFKGIDKETDMAYRKGNNNVLKELLKELEDGE